MSTASHVPLENAICGTGNSSCRGAYAPPTPARTRPTHAPTFPLPFRASSAPRPATGAPWLRLWDPRPSLGSPPVPSVAMCRGPSRPRGGTLSSPSLGAQLYQILCSAIWFHFSKGRPLTKMLLHRFIHFTLYWQNYRNLYGPFASQSQTAGLSPMCLALFFPLPNGRTIK